MTDDKLKTDQLTDRSGHASFEQLLEIRDGLECAAKAHVDDCSACQAELANLDCLRDAIIAEAEASVPEHLWERILDTAGSAAAPSSDAVVFDGGHALHSRITPDESSQNKRSDGDDIPVDLLVAKHVQSNQRTLSRAIYSLAASVMFTGIVGLYIFGQQSPDQQANQLLQANVQELMLNSRGMERALQKVSLQSDLLTASQRSEADRLYWRLAYLDQMIHENDVNNPNKPELVEALWNDRVDALTELSQLYYQRQQMLDDSEI